jgi:hypothetical protein
MLAFDPTAVFRTLYESACAEAYENTRGLMDGSRLPEDVVPILEDHMRQLFAVYVTLGSSAIMHKQQLASLRDEGLGADAHDCCSCCIRRSQQHKLPCGHGMCEICVRIFFAESEGERSVYDVDTCLLCGRSTSGMRIGIKPETASVRVLSIDGGGARARVPLEFLRALEERIGLPHPVQGHFDVAFGTSSGDDGFARTRHGHLD